MYPEFFWAEQRCHHGWYQPEQLSKFVLPDTLKMHSLALSFLTLLCKTFSKLFKLAFQKILFRWWFLKNSHIKYKICMNTGLWELWSSLSLKDAASSTVFFHFNLFVLLFSLLFAFLYFKLFLSNSIHGEITDLYFKSGKCFCCQILGA